MVEEGNRERVVVEEEQLRERQEEKGIGCDTRRLEGPNPEGEGCTVRMYEVHGEGR
jgi:hypothetical protein